MRKLVIVLTLVTGDLVFAQTRGIEEYRNNIYDLKEEELIKEEYQLYTDSLRRTLPWEESDSIRTWILIELCNNYKHIRYDSATYYAREAIKLAQTIGLHDAEALAALYYALSEIAIGNYTKALQLSLATLRIAEENELEYYKAQGKHFLGIVYLGSGQVGYAFTPLRESLAYFQKIQDESFSAMTEAHLAIAYSRIGKIDSTLYFTERAASRESLAPWAYKPVHNYLGKAYSYLDSTNQALNYFRMAKNDFSVEAHFDFESSMALAALFLKNNQLDSSLFYGRRALQIGVSTNFYAELIESYEFLSSLHSKTDPVRALEFNQLASSYRDSLVQMERSMAIDEYLTLEANRKQETLENEIEASKNRLKMNTLIGSSFTLLVVVLLLYRSRKAKQKSNEAIHSAYNQLQSTQTQLIHSEKMASLGELTAGIAHEIQNPLNFVNNFSEVNKELVEELIGELKKGNIKEAEDIGTDIIDNEEKVSHHGKRAEQIVKSMLQHSRTSEGQKEPTDINDLCDEYMRLAYHGFRAKDPSFQADFQLDLDPNLPQIEVIPQDIGRVLLNIINNAFQAVAEVENAQVKIKTGANSPSLERGSGGVKIEISDNGPGIPEEIKEKIFQPFFTTKPTGQGTGLGLSMSYDIVTKGHGGTIEVESENGKGTTFTIKLSK